MTDPGHERDSSLRLGTIGSTIAPRKRPRFGPHVSADDADEFEPESLVDATVEADDPTVVRGPAGPSHSPHARPPEALGLVDVEPGTSTVWLVGAHGGAGEDSLAAAGDSAQSWAPTEHRWPVSSDGTAVRALLCARTNVRGLEAAHAALIEWGKGAVPGVELLGLVLLADAPGRLPAPLRDYANVVTGGAPRSWRIGWIESWRYERAGPGSSTTGRRRTPGGLRDLDRLLSDIALIQTPTSKEH